MVATKTLRFYCDTSKLTTEELHLVLAFEKPNDMQLMSDQGVIAWRVLEFNRDTGSTIPKKAEVSWTPKVAFSTAQMVSGNRVTADNPINVDPGQNVSLTTTADGDLTWKRGADSAGSTMITATNETDVYQAISVCTVSGSDTFPVFYYGQVGATQSVELELHYVLKAYTYQDIQESEFMTADQATRKPIWSQNLVKLTNSLTKYDIVVNDNGSYSIKPHTD